MQKNFPYDGEYVFKADGTKIFADFVYSLDNESIDQFRRFEGELRRKFKTDNIKEELMVTKLAL